MSRLTMIAHDTAGRIHLPSRGLQVVGMPWKTVRGLVVSPDRYVSNSKFGGSSVGAVLAQRRIFDFSQPSQLCLRLCLCLCPCPKQSLGS
jgi:hypothetical protein